MRGRLFGQTGQYLDLILERGSSQDGPVERFPCFIMPSTGKVRLILCMLGGLFGSTESCIEGGTEVFP